MVIDMGGEHIGVSYGKIKRTPGQLDCERAREIFEGVQPQAVRIGLTVAEDIDEISENLREAMPDVLHLSGDIEGISPAEVAELKSRFPEDHAGHPGASRSASRRTEGHAVCEGL